MREMKRQNFQLQSKLKYLEQEIDTLNEKLEVTHKERNKLRKELNNMSQLSSGGASNGSGSGTTTSLDIMDMRSDDTPPPLATVNGDKNGLAAQTTGTQTTTISSSSRTLSTEMLDKSSFKSSSLNLSYWNELNASSSWDVNYNTGNIYKYLSRANGGAGENFTGSSGVLQNHQKNGNSGAGGGGGELFQSKPSYRRDVPSNQTAYIGSITSDLNAIINGPRPYR